jgi:hypothetical protein
MHIIATHAPRKIRLNWQQGPKTRTLAFKPFAADDGHGDAVDFTWRLLKAGFGNELFPRVSNLPPAQADKVFAMLAVFDREDCRSAAARHFGLPDLPAMMALAFSERPPLNAHLAMADFGHENRGWRTGFVSATGAYDAYGNARSFYYRSAVFNRMLHAPERLDFWLHSEWVNKYCDSAKDRETRRLVEQWRKAKSDRRKN